MAAANRWSTCPGREPLPCKVSRVICGVFVRSTQATATQQVLDHAAGDDPTLDAAITTQRNSF